MTPWEPIGLDEGSCYFWQIGPLRLWVQNLGAEWIEAHEYDAESEHYTSLVSARPAEKPPGLEWSRLICNEESSVLKLTPFLPDRPVVVGSKQTLKVLPGSDALFFVTVPMWISLCVGRHGASKLMEIPSVVLSNTWFGGLTSGEFCYSLKTAAYRTVKDALVFANELICPVRVKNVATTALDFKRLCVHVEHLKIYGGPVLLWTNEVAITHEGADLPSSVKYNETPPPFEERCVLINRERTPPERNLFKKSFSFLRYFTTTE